MENLPRGLQGRDLYQVMLAMHSAFSFWNYLLVVRSAFNFGQSQRWDAFVSIPVSHAKPRCSNLHLRYCSILPLNANAPSACIMSLNIIVRLILRLLLLVVARRSMIVVFP